MELLRAVAERYMRRIVEAGEHAREHRSISHSKVGKIAMKAHSAYRLASVQNRFHYRSSLFEEHLRDVITE